MKRFSQRFAHSLADHPMRHSVAGITHQRPFDRAPIPSIVSSFTTTHKVPIALDGVVCPLRTANRLPTGAPDWSTANDACFAHLRTLCEHFTVPPPHVGASFFTADLAGTCHLRWERHTEAMTYTFSRAATAEDMAAPFESSALPLSAVFLLSSNRQAFDWPLPGRP